nr:probable pectinesterase 55 isoform X2 [Ipomoea trifida]
MVKKVLLFLLVLGWVSGGRAQYWTIHVDQSGSSDFKTIQSAIDSVPSNNSNWNSYNYPPITKSSYPTIPAVAARVNGDKMAFYDCGFYGMQDTLFDAMGRHYFKHCTIEGAIDFIFGAGQSIFEECRIVVNVGKSLEEGDTGSITAQGRSGANDSNAFVFKNCNVSGNGKAILGRPWRDYSRVIFFNSSLSDIIVPPGWDSWFCGNHV